MTRRIARVITRLNVGGPAYQAVMLTHMLQARGYETILIAGRCESHEEQFDALIEQYPCEVVFCPHLQRTVNPFADVAAFRQVKAVLRDFKPDLVHTHTAKAGAIGRLAARSVNAKAIVHTFHGHVLAGYFPKLAERAVLGVERRLAKRTDAIIAISSRLGKEFADRYGIAPAEKIHVVELGLPLERFLNLPKRGHWREKLRIDDRAIVLGSLGRLVRIKNYARLVDVMARLVKLHPDKDLHAIIGGTGPLERALSQRIAHANLSNRVHLVGMVDDLPQFYADIDMGILTSDNEGTPVSLLEAQAAGRFVIAPDVGGTGDIVDPSTGIVVKPAVESYVDAISQILTRGDLPVVTEADRKATIARFSPERLVADVDRLYANLLDEGR